MKQPPSGTAGYHDNAVSLAEQYESIGFEDVHRDVLHWFPGTCCNVLDVGAGSGRDAAALALKGHLVVAVEPVEGLRNEGKKRHPLPNLEWIDDCLPELHATRQRNQGFGLILLTAVWMHLPAEERRDAMQVLSELILPAGRMIMTLRHGPVPEGRQMFDVSAQETIDLAGNFGLKHRYSGQRQDMFDRGDVSWSLVVLEKS
jgi:protein-L-isoaspartate O-methyltransferase